MSVNSPLRDPYKIKNSIIEEKKRHTVKALVSVFLVTGLILGVYCGKGRLHDFALFKKYRLKVHPKIAILADLGFLGIAKFHSKNWLPFKKSKNKPHQLELGGRISQFQISNKQPQLCQTLICKIIYYYIFLHLPFSQLILF